MESINMNSVISTLHIVSTFSAAFLSGYHYGSDRIALPNVLSSPSVSTADVVHSWYRAWDVGRTVGPLCVNVALLGNAALAYLEGPKSPSFWLHVAGSSAQVLNVVYTVFGVFRLNDKMLAEHSNLSFKKELSEGKKVRQWAQEWKDMDQKRMLLMNLTALAGIIALWKRI